jgi:hypothetical protein
VAGSLCVERPECGQIKLRLGVFLRIEGLAREQRSGLRRQLCNLEFLFLFAELNGQHFAIARD